MAPHTVRRHATNYIALLCLAFGLAVGLDWLLVKIGWPAIAGCAVRPFLYLLFSRSIALWLISIGAVLVLLPRTRPVGASLMLAGLAIDVLPMLLEHYLEPLCRRY